MECLQCGISFSPKRPKGVLCSRECAAIYNHDHRPVYSIEERLWAKTQKSDTCWVWIGAHLISGYGHMTINKKRVTVHRLSWEVHNGPIPIGMEILHRCDNPPCIRPDHLFIGTNQDNVDDMVSKKRHTYGDRNGHAVFTDDQAREILYLLRTKQATGRQIAQQYGVDETTISKMRLGITWKHLH